MKYNEKVVFKKLLIEAQETIKLIKSPIELAEMSSLIRLLAINLVEFLKQSNSIDTSLEVLSSLLKIPSLKGSEEKEIVAQKYPEAKFLAQVLSEDIKFYSSYPKGEFDFLKSKDLAYIHAYMKFGKSLLCKHICHLNHKLSGLKLRQEILHSVKLNLSKVNTQPDEQKENASKETPKTEESPTLSRI